MDAQSGDLSAVTAADLVRAVDARLLLRLEHAVADILWAAYRDRCFVALLEAIGSALRWPVGSVWRAADRPNWHWCGHWSASDFDGAPSSRPVGRRSSRPASTALAGLAVRAVRVDHRRRRRRELPAGRGCCEGRPTQRVLLPPAERRRRRRTGGVLLTAPDGSRTGTPRDDGQPRIAGRRVAATTTRRSCDAAERGPAARGPRRCVDAVVIADANGVVLEFNPAACATLGYQRDEAVGHELAELIIPPDLAAGTRRDWRAICARSSPACLTAGLRSPVNVRMVPCSRRADHHRIAVRGSPVFAGYLRDLVREASRRRGTARIETPRRRSGRRRTSAAGARPARRRAATPDSLGAPSIAPRTALPTSRYARRRSRYRARHTGRGCDRTARSRSRHSSEQPDPAQARRRAG